MTSSLELRLVAVDYVRVLNGERIKRAREERQLGQRDVATALNVSVSTVSNWERGKTVPKSRLAALEKLLHISRDDLETAEPAGPALADATDMELLMECFRRMQSGSAARSPRRGDSADDDEDLSGYTGAATDVTACADRVNPRRFGT